MTDSMNFGPDWIRNLSSEGNTSGGTSASHRYQLADYRYGREEMLALFDRNVRPPSTLSNFKYLYSDTTLLPLALTTPTTEEERSWQNRPTNVSGPVRGRGGSLERGGRIPRGRGAYQGYGRPQVGYDVNWGGNGEQPEWSPRKDFNPTRNSSVDNWRRTRNLEEDDGWRNVATGRNHDKWGRSTSWRGDGEQEERGGPPERGGRSSWHENRGPPSRRSWDNEDHLPEWATEHPTEGGGTFDERGAFHGSDDESPYEGRSPNKRDMSLQKSTSQQHISNKQHPPLSSSKSAMSLSKPPDFDKKREDQESHDESDKSENGTIDREREKSVPNIPEKIDKEPLVERAKSEGPPRIAEKVDNMQPQVQMSNPFNRAEEDFEKLQEDLVLKLVENEEPIKHQQNQNSFDLGGPVQPPPNLAPLIPEKWFYQDPQGQMQGPFTNLEMAEWFKAGYFSNQLKIRRQVDERFFLLGELVAICGGANPFTCGIRLPVLKNDVSKMADTEVLQQQFQYLSQVAAFKQAQARIVAEPWSALTMQQQELAAQRLLMQQQQVPQEIPFMQQPPAANPLMQMINQMQQANKLPGPSMVDKPPTNLPNQMDPHLQMHMGNMLLQNRLPSGGGLSNHLAGGLPASLVAPDGMPSGLSGLNPGVMPMPGMQGTLPGGLGTMNLLRQNAHGNVDQLGSSQDNEPLRNLLKQLQQGSAQKNLDSLWQQNQFSNSPPNPQWQPNQPDVPMSMWDVQQPPVSAAPVAATPPPLSQTEPGVAAPAASAAVSADKGAAPAPKPNDKEQQQHRAKEELKEMKKRKELEEKQAKKEAEERRKQEQRKQEAEKKAADEKKRKEEDRIKKELEKAKREAEEKRQKELEEKRRLKEQRKAEEEARKKTEEQKRQEEEKARREAKEQEERSRAAEKRLAQEQQMRQAKAAPWSQSSSSMGMSLADIQKAEREKRSQEAALQLQRQQLQEQQLQYQQQQEKPAGIHLSWAKKPVEAKKVKSLAEIQAEEQERLAKQAAEARLQKEKEAPVTSNANSIWNSQNLSWANTAATQSQWSSHTSSGFWDDSPFKQPPAATRPSTVPKSNSTNSISNNVKQLQQPQQQKQAKQSKPKKEDSHTATSKTTNNHNNNNNNGPTNDEFMNWCYKTLSNISTNVDIPTFVSFLRDIESAFELREYCKEYLGESNATQQFASSFLEKRRSFRPRANAHKDDMCSPAPAITPGLAQQHAAAAAANNDFQEVKGKNKKNKKSKMQKVDSRILGFNVTSAPDRINVGDRDYGDNS